MFVRLFFLLVTPPPSDLTERTPLAPSELREYPLVPLYAYRVLVLHVGRGLAPAATAEMLEAVASAGRAP